jgi:all-trans-nonaprenyl-diphosphate synthase
MTSVATLFAPVESDLQALSDNLRNLIGAKHPILYAAAEYLFGVSGKKIRPAIVLLIAKATAADHGLSQSHRRLAEITEMIHTASLVHDDVVDESDLRRNVPTVHSQFGNRVAVLAGDFLFAQSSWYLANLDNLEVVKLLSQVIMDMAEGEIQQGLNGFNTAMTWEDYLQKSYCKTASLIANSAKAAAILSDTPVSTADKCFEYGRNLGLAFQIVDDIFDFTSSAEALGKPAGADLASGNITAPVLFALEEKPHLETLIDRGLADSDDLAEAITLVKESSGIGRSRDLALYHAGLALDCLHALAPTESREALAEVTRYVTSRLY